jgi:cytochrome b561
MRLVLSVLLIALCAGSAFAGEPSISFESVMLERSWEPTPEVLAFPLGAVQTEESAAQADTTNKALDDMLAEFMNDPASTELAYDSWTLTAHRYVGYTILLAAGAQAILGSYTWDQEKQGKIPDTVDAHKYLGYTIVGLSLAQTTLGFYNFRQMKDRETGKTKRWIHLTLSTLATAGFIAGAAIAYNSRQEIESGEAGLEGKTFDDLYGTHQTVEILSVTSVFLTAIVVVW